MLISKSLRLPSQKSIPPVLKVAQKTDLIMGCDEDGNGNALAKGFHRKGLRVFATARTLAKVEHLKSLGIEILPLGVIDETSVKKKIEAAQKSK
jgi:1-acylglycerone phosphate reductase